MNILKIYFEWCWCCHSTSVVVPFGNNIPRLVDLAGSGVVVSMAPRGKTFEKDISFRQLFRFQNVVLKCVLRSLIGPEAKGFWGSVLDSSAFWALVLW